MKDLGIDKGLVKKFDTSKPEFKGFFGFRKLFWTYLKKLNVPFFDPCCAEADGQDIEPLGWDESQGQFVRYNGSAWVPVISFTTTTSTSTSTTTSSSTTSTTTTP